MKEQKRRDEHSSNPNLRLLLLPSTPTHPHSLSHSHSLSSLVSYQIHISNIQIPFFTHKWTGGLEILMVYSSHIFSC